MIHHFHLLLLLFYDNSILPGTKIQVIQHREITLFYDNSILPGTKIQPMRD